MTTLRYNPGNLHVRLGASLQLYEEAVYRSDLETASNVLGIIETYCKVHMKDDERKHLDAMPAFVYGDARELGQIFRDMNARLLYVLDTVRHFGVFTKAPVEIGDATSLDDETQEEASA